MTRIGPASAALGVACIILSTDEHQLGVSAKLAKLGSPFVSLSSDHAKSVLTGDDQVSTSGTESGIWSSTNSHVDEAGSEPSSSDDLKKSLANLEAAFEPQRLEKLGALIRGLNNGDGQESRFRGLVNRVRNGLAWGDVTSNVYRPLDDSVRTEEAPDGTISHFDAAGYIISKTQENGGSSLRQVEPARTWSVPLLSRWRSSREAGAGADATKRDEEQAVAPSSTISDKELSKNIDSLIDNINTLKSRTTPESRWWPYINSLSWTTNAWKDAVWGMELQYASSRVAATSISGTNYQASEEELSNAAAESHVPVHVSWIPTAGSDSYWQTLRSSSGITDDIERTDCATREGRYCEEQSELTARPEYELPVEAQPGVKEAQASSPKIHFEPQMVVMVQGLNKTHMELNNHDANELEKTSLELSQEKRPQDAEELSEVTARPEYQLPVEAQPEVKEAQAWTPKTNFEPQMVVKVQGLIKTHMELNNHECTLLEKRVDKRDNSVYWTAHCPTAPNVAAHSDKSKGTKNPENKKFFLREKNMLLIKSLGRR